uniref:Polyamine modulated factor 1 binding protein 1 n=1 Tax=Jaculus jaculus TaxID=51337 RepID=A0A8C5L939_JACJA
MLTLRGLSCAGERDREVSNLNSKLLSLQLDIKSLHDVCKRQGKTLQENQLCVEEAMMSNSHNKNQAQALAFRESQMEFGSSKQCHLRQLQQLKQKLLALQQELEFRTEELQTSYCSLLQYQSILEKQTSDLVLLHHHCKLKEDEVILYEEEMGNHNENTGEKLHLAQEQLALAGDKIVSLERSLNLYRDKYQTSLSNIELLECQVKMLEGELSGIISQEPESKGDHSKASLYTSSCMIQEHQETLKRLSEVWQKVSEQDDLIQELRNKLACSNAMVSRLIIKPQGKKRRKESHLNSCFSLTILKHLQEQKDSQCLHVEEYQNLVKDLRMELEAVSEQKKNIMKDMMKLELDLHGLREETSAHIERKDKETALLQLRLQELQLQYTETQKLALKKDKLLQDKDEMLHEMEKKLTWVQNSLMKKEKEIEKQQRMLAELERAVKEAKQDQFKEECGVLRREVLTLKESLEEPGAAQLSQHAAQSKEEAQLAGSSLEDFQRKLQSCALQDKQKGETIQELQREVQKLHQELAAAEEERTSSRYPAPHPRASRAGRAERRGQPQSPPTKALEPFLTLSLCFRKQIEELSFKLAEQRELANAKSNLEEDLRDAKKSLAEKQEQLKKSKDRERLLEEEIENLQQEEKKKEKMFKDHLRKLEDEKSNLQTELDDCSAQLEATISKYNTTQKNIQELKIEITRQKESIMTLQSQLDIAVQKEKQYLQTMVSKEVYEELSRTSRACQDDLTQTLEKLNQATSETKYLQRSLQQTQEKKTQLEDEIVAYEERMKKLNVELKKLQSFHQQSELEVNSFDKKLEEMSSQVLQWQKQHQNDLKMLAAKETQLREFQEEMATLKENLLADEKELLSLPPPSILPKDSCRLHRDNEQIMCNMEQWAKEQKIANEKLGNKLREQVKYIAKLTGEKDHLHNVMVHLQQENKKLKNEIEEKKMKACNMRPCTKALGPSKAEPTQKGKAYGTLGWKGASHDLGQKMDITKYIGMPHCSGSSYC